MRTVHVTRYITPLREGGSMPAVVEADDDGMYVLKFRGAGQGPRALVAELVAGEMARLLGLPMPEIVLAEVDVSLADTEPDPEIQELVRASGGTNLAVDYLPGAFAFDPAAHAITVDADLASRIVWFDAFVSNLDRTRRNTNLLVWHRRLQLIDHGAALYFHHSPGPFAERAGDRFPLIAQHVLLPLASRIAAVDDALAAVLSPAHVDSILAQVPSAWLQANGTALDDGAGHLPADTSAVRRDYADYFAVRLLGPRAYAQEAIEAHGRVA
jgi:hypothetical protein